MARSFKLPDLGEGIHEGEVLAVPVSVGQEIKEGDIILEVETDKAAVEIPSPFTGRVEEIFVKSGDIVNVGDVMMTFSNGEGDVADVAEKQPERLTASSEAASAAAQPARKPGKGPVPASPATRRVARELGIDLSVVPPSGPAGLVTAEDVRSFAEKGKPVAAAPVAPAAHPVELGPSSISQPELPDFSLPTTF